MQNPYQPPTAEPRNGESQDQARSTSIVLKRVFWGTFTATLMIIFVIPLVAQLLYNAAWARSVLSVYKPFLPLIAFLDEPMRQNGFGDEMFRAPVNLFTILGWSFLAAFIAKTIVAATRR